MSLPATVTMTENDARRITERIRYTALSARESLEKLQALVTQAQEGQAHVALGYASWTAYLADVLGDQPLRLPRDQRQQLVGYLAGEGMSTRAIAPIVGVTDRQIRRDISGGTNVPPAQTPSAEAATTAGDAEVEGSGEAVSDPPSAPVRPTVTGLDGKTYTRPAPPERKPQRRPITDQARDAGWDLTKSVERIQRIASDDRFAPNKEVVATHLRSHLTTAVEVCQDLLDRINNN